MVVEGVGRWLEVSWAAYLTVVSTSLLIPVEVYEIVDRVSFVRVGALFLNLGIVGYVISQLKHHHLRKQAGRVTVNRVPCPNVLSTVTVPPWDSAISFTIASPSPVPPDSLARAGSAR